MCKLLIIIIYTSKAFNVSLQHCSFQCTRVTYLVTCSNLTTSEGLDDQTAREPAVVSGKPLLVQQIM